MGRERPEHRTHPSRFGGGRAFLTLSTQGAASTMADASGIQQTIRAIARGSAFLWIERTIGGTEQASLGLQRKSRSWKAGSQTKGVPIGRGHTPLWKPARLRPSAREWEPARLRELERIRLFAWECKRGAVPVPDADSTSIGSGSASIPVRKRHENTSEQGPAHCLHPRGPSQRTLAAATDPAHLSP